MSELKENHPPIFNPFPITNVLRDDQKMQPQNDSIAGKKSNHFFNGSSPAKQKSNRITNNQNIKRPYRLKFALKIFLGLIVLSACVYGLVTFQEVQAQIPSSANSSKNKDQSSGLPPNGLPNSIISKPVSGNNPVPSSPVNNKNRPNNNSGNVTANGIQPVSGSIPAATNNPLPSLKSATPGVSAGKTDGQIPNNSNEIGGIDSGMNRFKNLNDLPIITRGMVLNLQRAKEFLYRMNQPNGRFIYGWVPALNAPLEGDNLLSQAISTYGLARLSRFMMDPKLIARAKQAVLSDLSETYIEPDHAGVRLPLPPSITNNRLGTAGMMIASIGELPDPPADLINKAEELCQWLKRQQQSDGSLRYQDGNALDANKLDPQGIHRYPGMALFGLMISQRIRPADWKLAMMEKALPFYQKYFNAFPDPEFVAWMTLAYVEAYEQTQKKSYLDWVMQMNDWLQKNQYRDGNTKAVWEGGFRLARQGKILGGDPSIQSAIYCWSLGECCRAIRSQKEPDLERFQQYQSALHLGLQYVNRLQYTTDNTLQFTAKYSSVLSGGYYQSLQDGNLKCENTAFAICAQIRFLDSVAETNKVSDPSH